MGRDDITLCSRGPREDKWVASLATAWMGWGGGGGQNGNVALFKNKQFF